MYQEWFKEYEKVKKEGKNKMCEYETIQRLDECDEEEIRNLLIGRKVKVEGDNLVLDNGIILEIEANERLWRV